MQMIAIVLKSLTAGQVSDGTSASRKAQPNRSPPSLQSVLRSNRPHRASFSGFCHEESFRQNLVSQAQGLSSYWHLRSRILCARTYVIQLNEFVLASQAIWRFRYPILKNPTAAFSHAILHYTIHELPVNVANALLLAKILISNRTIPNEAQVGYGELPHGSDPGILTACSLADLTIVISPNSMRGTAVLPHASTVTDMLQQLCPTTCLWSPTMEVISM